MSKAKRAVLPAVGKMRLCRRIFCAFGDSPAIVFREADPPVDPLGTKVERVGLNALRKMRLAA